MKIYPSQIASKELFKHIDGSLWIVCAIIPENEFFYNIFPFSYSMGIDGTKPYFNQGPNIQFEENGLHKRVPVLTRENLAQALSAEFFHPNY